MSADLVELALKKQRLIARSTELREDWRHHATALEPWCGGADRVRDAGRWLQRHPQWLVGGAVALLVARPRAVFRWARRAVVAIGYWQQTRAWLTGTPRRL